MIDSRSVKAPQLTTSGYDAGKNVGRKRITRSMRMGGCYGRTDAGRHLRQRRLSGDLDGIRKRWPWVKHLFADGA